MKTSYLTLLLVFLVSLQGISQNCSALKGKWWINDLPYTFHDDGLIYNRNGNTKGKYTCSNGQFYVEKNWTQLEDGKKGSFEKTHLRMDASNTKIYEVASGKLFAEKITRELGKVVWEPYKGTIPANAVYSSGDPNEKIVICRCVYERDKYMDEPGNSVYVGRIENGKCVAALDFGERSNPAKPFVYSPIYFEVMTTTAPMTIEYFPETTRAELAKTDAKYKAIGNRVQAGFLIGSYQHHVGLASYNGKEYPATIFYDYPYGYKAAFVVDNEVVEVTNPQDIKWVLAVP